jgi:hypothetical protein
MVNGPSDRNPVNEHHLSFRRFRAFGGQGGDNNIRTSYTISNSGHGGGWTRAAGPYSWFDRFSAPLELLSNMTEQAAAT